MLSTAARRRSRSSALLLSLEQIYGAITFYLSLEQEIDSYLEQSEKEFEAQAKEMNAEARRANPELFDRLERERQERGTTRR